MANGNKRGTLCWDCANCIDGCSWSRSFKPVKGWDAEPVHTKYFDSYCVKSCPKFVADSIRGGLQRIDETRAQARMKTKGYENCEPVTKMQRQMVEYIMEESVERPTMFTGTTKAEADKWIRENMKFVVKEDRKERTWWAKG